jgi:regulation of enolase protein 1 (concanavalin A-like superfamily)
MMNRRNRRLTVVVCFTVATLGGVWTRAQGTAVPSPWASRDIGSPSIAGASSFDQASGTFSIDAAGADIWGTADQFHFVYQPLAGDTVITARVDALSAANTWSKAGVMIRSSLAANAAHAYALVSAGNGSAFQRRRSVGGTSVHTSGSFTAVAPLWVRLTRSGSMVTASVSSNGTSWTTIGSDTVALGATAYVGLAVTSHDVAQSTSAALSSVTATTTGALPSPQQSQDIGSPAIAGSAAFSQGTYTVTAAGRDIGDTADQFHYVYQPLTGDMDVSVRVASLAGVPPLAKAGVMIRENLTPGSAHALAALSRDSGYLFQRRPAAGGTSLQGTAVAGATPGWVRLNRTGDLITAYRSLDGNTWTAMGSDSFPMADTVYVGIAVTSRDVSAATTATLTNLIINQSLPPNQPPTATLSAPVSGATYTAPATIGVTASASDADGTVARVDFYNGTTLLASDTTAPYAITWSNVAAGTYTLRATAVDDAGGTGSSATATVTVTAPANQIPTATLTSPANGASFTAPATVSLTASASDADGTVARVDFYNGSALLGTDASAPYAFTWGSVAPGTYALRAIAVDNAGASGASATATITVSGAASGLVSAYGLNEGGGTVAGDSAGNAPGTITGATWVTGRYGQALSFDGSDQVVLADTDLGSFTVMGWLQTRSLYTNGCASFVMKALDYGLEMCNGQLWGSVGTGTGWTSTVKFAWPAADLNVWKHVALTYDGTTVRLYVEGVLVGSGTGAHGTNNNPLIFGRWTPASEYWNGLIDEVRIYNRRLTQTEIQTDRNTPIGGGSGSNQPPAATLTGPANGATYTAPASITLTATASDSDGSVARVDFYNGSTLLGSDPTVPYSFTWSNVAAGTYSLKATAVDNAGASGSSSVASVTVTGANQPPTVTLTAPANGATYAAPATLTLTANATDANGSVARVEFYNGAALLGTDTTAPYAFAWSGVPAGTYALHAVAYDNVGASATSATATITVGAAPAPPTGVVFQASADHATVTSYLLEIFANGADPNTATPVASSDLGKPTPGTNGDITVNRATLFSGLAPGTYILTVASIASDGTSRSESVTFSR